MNLFDLPLKKTDLARVANGRGCKAFTFAFNRKVPTKGQRSQAAWILEHYEFYKDDPKLARKIHNFETQALKFMELMQ